MKKVLFLASVLVLVTSCKEEKTVAQAEVIPGIVLENMDSLISPKDDFYNYVNGNWMKTTDIPEDRTSWGGFTVLRKSTDNDVLDILAKAKESNAYGPETDQAKALAIFDTKLDSTARDEAGIAPLQPALDAIAGIKNLSDLQTVLATSPAVSSPFISIGAGADLNNSSINAVYLGANGLGLPDRDFYFDQDEKSKEIRTKYKEHIAKMLQRLGDSESDAVAAAERILELETQLAEPRLNKVERRDARNYNNPRSISDIEAMLPSIDFNKMISDLGITKKFDTLLVTQLRYTESLDAFLKDTPIEDIKTLVRWDTFNSAAGRLTTAIETANWEFYSKYLRGAKKTAPS